MTQTDTLAISTLKELALAGAVTSIRLVAQADGFAIFVRYGLIEKALQAKRGHIRRFKSLNRAAAFVRELGFTHLEIDVSDWQPRQRAL